MMMMVMKLWSLKFKKSNFIFAYMIMFYQHIENQA